MALSDITLTADVKLLESKALRDVAELGRKMERGLALPLGRVSKAASEFDKSLAAANARVIAFGASAGIIFGVQRAFAALVRSTIDVEKSLTDIKVILDDTNVDLTKFGDGLFDVARKSGQSFKTVAASAQELARQGLSTEETLRRVYDAMVLVRQGGVQAQEAVEALTAITNTYAKTGVTTSQVVNKLANVDKAFAVSMEDLAEGLSKVGSTAGDMGVELDNLFGLITAVKQITQRSGSEIGNSLKTIFQRITQPDTIEFLEEQIKVQVQTTDGYRSMSDVLVDLAQKYQTLSPQLQNQVVLLAANIYQADKFRALMDDLANATGTYAQATKIAGASTNEAYVRMAEQNETLASKINAVQTQFIKLGSTIGNLTFAEPLRELLTVLDGAGQSIDKLRQGAGKNVLEGLGDFLTGPGLLAAGFIFGKLVKDAIVFTKEALKSFTGIGAALQQQVQLQQLVTAALTKQPDLINRVLSGKMTQLQLEREILATIQAQTAASSAASGVAMPVAAGLFKSGVRLKGGVPTFSPVSEAIKRESAAGVPNSLIRVGSHPSLKSSFNPAGMGVYNLRDEPAGLSQGISQARAMGYDPKTHGVPNFASDKPYTFNTLVPSHFNDLLKRERDKIFQQIQTSQMTIKSMSELNDIAKKLGKTFNADEKSIRRLTQSFTYAYNTRTGTLPNAAQTATARAGMYGGAETFPLFYGLKDFRQNVKNSKTAADSQLLNYWTTQGTLVPRTNLQMLALNPINASVKRGINAVNNLQVAPATVTPPSSDPRIASGYSIAPALNLGRTVQHEKYNIADAFDRTNYNYPHKDLFADVRRMEAWRADFDARNARPSGTGFWYSRYNPFSRNPFGRNNNPFGENYRARQGVFSRAGAFMRRPMVRNTALGLGFAAPMINSALAEGYDPSVAEDRMALARNEWVTDIAMYGGTGAMLGPKGALIGAGIGALTGGYKYYNRGKKESSLELDQRILAGQATAVDRAIEPKRGVNPVAYGENLMALRDSIREAQLIYSQKYGQGAIDSDIKSRRYAMGMDYFSRRDQTPEGRIKNDLMNSLTDVEGSYFQKIYGLKQGINSKFSSFGEGTLQGLLGNISQNAAKSPHIAKNIYEAYTALQSISDLVDEGKWADAQTALRDVKDIQFTNDPELNRTLKEQVRELETELKSAAIQSNIFTHELNESSRLLEERAEEEREYLRFLNGPMQKAMYRRGQMFSDDYGSQMVDSRNNKILYPETYGRYNVGRDTGASFVDSLRYDTQDLYRDLNEGAYEVGQNLKDSFKGAFKEFADGTKTANEALRSFGINFADRILSKVIDSGFDMLMGAAINGVTALGSNYFSSWGKKANGGLIRGYSVGGSVVGGSGTRDDVPAMLTEGEYVIKKSSVRKYGEGFLRQLNSGRVSSRLVNQYDFNDPVRPTDGKNNVDANLSNFALSDENNPQNAIRMNRESTLMQYIKDRADYEEAKDIAMYNFKLAKKQRIQAAYIAAGMQIAGAGLQAGIGAYQNSSGGNYQPKYNNNDYGRPPAGYVAVPGSHGGMIKRFAAGGLSGGDNVPALLMGGEFVMNRNAVNKYGVDFFNRLNAGRYAGGGLVGGVQNASAPGGEKLNENLLRLITSTETLRESLEKMSGKRDSRSIPETKESNATTPSSSPVINVYNTITVSSSQGEPSVTTSTRTEGAKKESDEEMNRKLGQQIEAAVIKVFIDQSRPGGIVYEQLRR